MTISKDDPNVLFTKQNIWGNNKDVTLKDLAKVRGKGMGKVTTAYNQVKLFISKGIIIKEKDIETFVRGLKPDRLEAINQRFNEALATKQEVVPDKKMEAKVQKETKQTIKSAQAFAKVLSNNFDLIPRKEGLATDAEKLEDTRRVWDAIDNPKNIAQTLEVAQFIDKNMENILKSTLFALRSRPGFKELPEGPGKDFINFIKDKNITIKNDADLKGATKEFENHIREGNIEIKILREYPKNPEFLHFMKFKEVNKVVHLENNNFDETLKEKPLHTLQIIQNREIIYSELNSVKGLSNTSLFNLALLHNSAHIALKWV